MATYEKLVDAIRHVVQHYAREAGNWDDAWVSYSQLQQALKSSPFNDYSDIQLTKALGTLAEEMTVEIRGPEDAITREHLYSEGCQYRYNPAGEEFFHRFSNNRGVVNIHVPKP
jgi:hypothetical protein